MIWPIKGLYAITPEMGDTRQLLKQVELIIAGGARILQYRSKSADTQLKFDQARQLQALCSQQAVTFIINDDLEMAAELKADGVHLGQTDHSILHARALLGSDALIGASCYDQVELARQAAANGADYLAFGAVFQSLSKPDTVHAPLTLFSQARNLNLPLVAIGGITEKNADSVISAGADAIAVINGLFSAPDPYQAACTLSDLFR